MKPFERIALAIHDLSGKVTLKEMGVSNFWEGGREGGKEIGLKQEKRPISLGLEGGFLQFVSGTLEHPLYNCSKSWQEN